MDSTMNSDLNLNSLHFRCFRSDFRFRPSQNTIKMYILTQFLSFLFSPSLSLSRVWMRIFPALRFLFAELNLCHVSKWARSSAQGLQQVLHVINFPGFIKCLIFITEEEEGLPWPSGPWLLYFCLLDDSYYNPFGTEKQEVGTCIFLGTISQGLRHCWDVEHPQHLLSSSPLFLGCLMFVAVSHAAHNVWLLQSLPAPELFSWNPRDRRFVFSPQVWSCHGNGGSVDILLGLRLCFSHCWIQEQGCKQPHGKSVAKWWTPGRFHAAKNSGMCLVGCWAAPQLTCKARSLSRCPV